MPFTHTPEGATEPITVFTADEVEVQKQAAIAEAKEAVRKELEADPNGIAAAARREAEKKAREAEKLAAAKETELAKALEDTGKSAEQLKALQEELKAARAEREQAAADVDGVKADFARKTALIEAGAKPAKVGAVEALLQADGVDLSDGAALAKAMAALKADAPGLFIDGKAGGYHPAGGAKNPPANPGAQSVAEIEAMTPREYEKWRKDNFRR